MRARQLCGVLPILSDLQLSARRKNERKFRRRHQGLLARRTRPIFRWKQLGVAEELFRHASRDFRS